MPRDIWPILILFAPVLLAVVPLSIIAFRGRTRRSQPLCRACGQAFGDASPDDQRVCPYCRADLTAKKTVKLARQGTRWGVLAVAVVLLLLPVGSYFGFYMAEGYYQRVMNPHSRPRYQSTSRLVQQAVNKPSGASQQWRELARRYEKGRISHQQAWRIVDQLTKRMKQQTQGWNSPMHWSEQFLKRVFGDEQVQVKRLRAFVKACQGSVTPIHGMPRRAKPGQKVRFRLGNTSRWPIPGPIRAVWKIRSVRVGDQSTPILPAPILQRTTFREGIFRCNVKPGDYQVHIKVDTVLVREKHLLGFDLASMSDEDWPPALDQWTQKVTAPLKVVAR